MLAKARTRVPDEVVIDLEDAVSAGEKTSQTRQLVVDALLQTDWQAFTLSARVNAVGSQWFVDDVTHLVRLAGHRLHSVVVPKVESVEDVRAVDLLLTELERESGARPLAIEAQIETARGLVQVEQIAASSPRLEALIFGPGDYAASLGIPQAQIGGIAPDYPGDQWHYPRSRIAVAAHAHGLDAIDGPFAGFRDEAILIETARRARLVGFSGKWVIHPSQIEPCNAVFSPSAEEVSAARGTLAALDLAAREGGGATAQDGSMIDAASRRAAEAILARARETGAP
jgi:citrate lyase beta subunit